MGGVVLVAHLAQRCLFFDKVIQAIVRARNRTVCRVDYVCQTIRLIVRVGDGTVTLVAALSKCGRYLPVEKIVLINNYISATVGELSKVAVCIVDVMLCGAQRVGAADESVHRIVRVYGGATLGIGYAGHIAVGVIDEERYCSIGGNNLSLVAKRVIVNSIAISEWIDRTDYVARGVSGEGCPTSRRVGHRRQGAVSISKLGRHTSRIG